MHNNNGFSTQDILNDAVNNINDMINNKFDVISIGEPKNIGYASFMAKIESKISSIVGNMIEYAMAQHLNDTSSFSEIGSWERQDPDFPDNVFISDKLKEKPGIEVKAWYPLATEITARFKPSQSILKNHNPLLALVAWLPEYVLHGKPQIIGVKIIPAMELAKSRDNHYFNPPSYLVVEPENTSNRTKNLQQRNVNGFKSQNWSKEQIQEATEFLKSVNFASHDYLLADKTQDTIKYLLHHFDYREETNFAKINRIENPDVQEFKRTIMDHQFHGKPISYWSHISKDQDVVKYYYENIFKGN